MTYEEQQEYNKLSNDAKDEYNFIKSKHPTWSHNQIIQRMAVTIKIGDMLNKGKDVDPNDPEILTEILKGAKSILVNLDIIINGFFEAIDDALNILGTLIESGAKYIGDKLKAFWDWLTN